MKENELYYRTLLKSELRQVEAQMLQPHEGLPDSIAAAIKRMINSGGKRLRPSMVLLSTHICGVNAEEALPIAASIEMLHTATLIHDDLIDDAQTRRNTPTLNARWTPAATVLIGDLAFAWAAKFIARGKQVHLMRRFAETLETICFGELNQMFEGKGRLPVLEAYYDRIFAKTASLFMLTTEVGALLAELPAPQVQQMAEFGRHVGLAFQIVDDVLDFMGEPETLGKPVAGDLRQGLLTLPILYYQEAHPDDTRIEQALENLHNEPLIAEIIVALRRSNAPERAMQTAEQHIETALDILRTYPASPHRAALEEIATFAIRRRY